MAGKKLTLKDVVKAIEVLKESHEEEISEMKKTINVQETRIKQLEKWLTNDKPIDSTKKPGDTKKLVQLNIESLERKEFKKLTCKNCDDKFNKFCDLEENHGNSKQKECYKNTKKFVTSWRMKKHVRIHFQKFTKLCNYFKQRI